ncbi:MAG: 5-(carboxyamino)imidazole ribonucleotide mutase [Planctomycetia bacterium]|nr:5-(carboxyamino)imidazole ribonucleotide mutase [Planctomycetia bacterium]
MSNQPQVGIVMGSDSDFPKIQNALTALDSFGISYVVHVMSAHRTPRLVEDFAKNARANGLRVLIAAAGGAAHLAGVVAAHTTLPVIGIPVATDLMGGLDSLLSTVQMPGDIPVATVGTGSGGAKNAGILAAEILAVADDGVREKLDAFRQKLVQKILDKDAALQEKLSHGKNA